MKRGDAVFRIDGPDDGVGAITGTVLSISPDGDYIAVQHDNTCKTRRTYRAKDWRVRATLTTNNLEGESS